MRVLGCQREPAHFGQRRILGLLAHRDAMAQRDQAIEIVDVLVRQRHLHDQRVVAGIGFERRQRLSQVGLAGIEFFRNGSGVALADDFLTAAHPMAAEAEREAAIKDLLDWAVLIRQPRLGGYALFAGSDFDLEQPAAKKAIEAAAAAAATPNAGTIPLLLEAARELSMATVASPAFAGRRHDPLVEAPPANPSPPITSMVIRALTSSAVLPPRRSTRARASLRPRVLSLPVNTTS